MKIIKKEELKNALEEVIRSYDIVQGVGKNSGKTYVALQITGMNGHKLLRFFDTTDFLRLGIVVDDEQ